MRAKTTGVTLAAACAVLALAGSAQAAPAPAPEDASTGKVAVFTMDYLPMKIYEDPEGCQTLPVGSHVLSNLTDRPVQLYADPLCLVPSPVKVLPGHGAHVPPMAGSFSVG